MKTIGKIVAAGLILLVICVAGCAALVGAGANEAAKAIDKAQKSDTAAARQFKTKFAKIKVGNTLTGKGGMSFAEVKAIIGAPKPRDVMESRSQGMKLTTWSYTFLMSDESMSYSIDFANGHVMGKTRI